MGVPRRSSAGFTLLEMLLVLALFATLAGIAVPLYRSQWLNNDLRSAETVIVSSLHRASVLAQSGAEDDRWGVAIVPGSVTVFRGDTYAEHPDSHEVTSVSEVLVASGDTEVVFQKNTGFPSQAATLTIASHEAQSFEVTISDQGIIDVEYE